MLCLLFSPAETTNPFELSLPFANDVLNRASEDAVEYTPKYRSSSPLDSPKQTKIFNKVFSAIRDLTSVIGHLFDLKEIIDLSKNIARGIVERGKILLGEVAQLIWLGVQKLVDFANKVAGFFLTFVDWVGEVTGQEQKFVDWMNKNW